MAAILRRDRSETRGLSLRLEPAKVVMRRYPILGIAAHLTNNGSRPRTLVLPGDGSCMGWRTPVIEWRFQPSRKVRPCGDCANINAIKAGEVFILEPGATRVFDRWIQPAALPAARRFRAVMVYSNDPGLPFGLEGAVLEEHDCGELARLRGSDDCRVTSNEIEVYVENEDLDWADPR